MRMCKTHVVRKIHIQNSNSNINSSTIHKLNFNKYEL